MPRQSPIGSKALLLVPALASLLIAACTTGAPDGARGDAADARSPTAADTHARAVAELRTAAGQASGRAELTETAQGVELHIQVRGLTPGKHGFHVHANGACEPGPDAATGNIVPFGAAGGHFDPGHSRNHGQPGQPVHEAHAGELPNITVGADGTGTLRYVHPHVTVRSGKMSVMGRALVVHDSEDDYATDPAGNSGPRVLCGLIEPSARGAVRARTIIEGGNVFPEGIAVDARSGQAYVGSSTEGHIWRWSPGTGKAEMFQAGGAVGRQAAYGMKLDPAGRLWVAGGATSAVAVIDTTTAATLAVLKAPQDSHGFLNDLAVASDGYTYVTDSFRPVLFRARYTPGATAAPLEPWLDFRGTALRYVANQINLNGIVASPDGRTLLAIQLVTGQLWRIDTATKAVTQVRVEGADLQHGDGLELAGQDLYVVRNESNEVVRLALADGWHSARLVERISDTRLKFPTTAAATSAGLLVVNGQLNKIKEPPPLLPFDVVTLAVGR